MRNRILLIIIGAQLQAFGVSLRAMDSDSKGNDDVIGSALQLSGSAIGALANSDTKGFRKYLKLVADSINEFLATSENLGVQ